MEDETNKEIVVSNNDTLFSKNKNKPNISLIILLILVIVLIFGLAYYFGTKSKTFTENVVILPVPSATVEETAEPVPPITPTETVDVCQSTLTATDKEMIKNWKTYKNLKYNFNFQYPRTWQIEDQQSDRVVLSSGSDKLNFYFTSAEMSAFDLMQYKKDSEENIKVACEDATKVFMSGNPEYEGGVTSKQKAIVTSFKKNDIPHVIMMDYKDQGASISGDIKEAYDIILKTVEFK